MTTEHPDARRGTSPALRSVPTPRSGVPTAGFGVSAISSREPSDHTPVIEPERRSRAVTIAGALLAVVAVVAAVVVFRIIVPTVPSAAAGQETSVRSSDREQPGSIVGFGNPHSYGDGLEVAVNPPQRYEPSDNATGVDEGVAVKMQVVVTNRTDQAFRPNTLQVRATSGGQPGVAVWDPDQGIALTGPDVSIPSGSTFTFFLAFAVADPGDLVLEVTPALYGYGATVVQG
ncbi:hypothetical protein [Cellulomonas dongxiuzhuiae]|uniref:hypothetical protein n=1 Tax=Cellulomonas dongxiuzhuiae TaxID=2819979 RepID=UPI001AAFE756|nr:hypothetical protein [Cellulomonas dongxiuzhuiae]MBO3089617.1 hypothetical protein [Cellulomonas dongxiuzhuiae]